MNRHNLGCGKGLLGPRQDEDYGLIDFETGDNKKMGGGGGGGAGMPRSIIVDAAVLVQDMTTH